MGTHPQTQLGAFSSAPTIALKLFGVPELRARGNSASNITAHPRRIALLALLVLEDRPVPRRELFDLLWPDTPRRAADDQLSRAIAAIRDAFPAPAHLLDEDESLRFDLGG